MQSYRSRGEYANTPLGKYPPKATTCHLSTLSIVSIVWSLFVDAPPPQGRILKKMPWYPVQPNFLKLTQVRNKSRLEML
jgi:hypothetical protein